MDILFEFIVELILEGSIEIGTNKKISKWIRYPLLGIIALFFAIVIFGLLYLGILLFNENFILSTLIILCSLFLLIGSIFKLKNVYEEEKKGLDKNI